MKKIKISHLRDKKKSNAHKEVKILKSTKHPNIIKYYTSFHNRKYLFIIMEYASNGDLHQVLIKK
jgi:serine/threonine protein kinase